MNKLGLPYYLYLGDELVIVVNIEKRKRKNGAKIDQVYYTLEDGTIKHASFFKKVDIKLIKRDFILNNYCSDKNLKLTIGRTELKPESNKEKIWSDLRYEFFSQFDFPIMTCHHLDDCVETYLFSCLRGFQSIIPYSKANIIRPFLLNEKSVFERWCKQKSVPFIKDESNDCLDYSRNRIRHKIVPEALLVNPGLKTVVKKMIKL